MGLEAAYIPYIVAAVGAYGGAANSAHTARKQDRQLAAGITEQGQRQQEAAKEVNALVESRGKSNAGGAISNSEQQLMDTLRRNAGGKGVIPQIEGASQRYMAQVEQGNESVGDFGSELAGQISNVDAAAVQRAQENAGMIGAGTRLNEIQRRAAGDNFVNQTKVKGITNNPYIDLASKLAVNTGMAGAMQGGFGGASKYGQIGKMTTGGGSNFTPTNYASDPFKAGEGLRMFA